MKNTLIQHKTCILKSKIHGLGVFAKKTIKRNEIIEECYSLTVSHCDDLMDYLFEMHNQKILPLGSGCLFNHHFDANASVNFDKEKNITFFTATKNIKKGEEIFISYGKDWFASREIPVIQTPKKSWNYFFLFLVRALLITSFILSLAYLSPEMLAIMKKIKIM